MKPAPPVTSTTSSMGMIQSLVRDTRGGNALCNRLAAPGDKPPILESQIPLSVAQPRPIEREHGTAGGVEDRVAGGRIPFHGGGEARIDVGLASRNQAELQGRARACEPCDIAAAQPLLGLSVQVRSADERREARG